MRSRKMLFLGIETMGSVMKPLSSSPIFLELIGKVADIQFKHKYNRLSGRAVFKRCSHRRAGNPDR